MDLDVALKLLRGGTKGIDQWNRRRESGEGIPDLIGASLRNADIRGANLSGANLIDSNIIDSDLSDGNLSGANLSGANVRTVSFKGAKLIAADLSAANLSEVDLSDADLSRAKCWHTVFAKVDLSRVNGLDLVWHVGPSTIGIDSFVESDGKIPKGFLKGCGLPETLIKEIPPLVRSIKYYRCFISYATADEEFASRIHNDFQAVGIRCWKWNHDARTGRSLWGEIDKMIRSYDKLLLVASKSSLESPAVNREIERAIVEEDKRFKSKKTGDARVDIDMLFPVAIDDHLFTKWKHERKVDVTKKVIADAKGWQSDPGVYAKVLDKLIRDLQVRRRKKPH
jgi:TIR domain/Pentapeptide repeats (8 copies)